MLGEALDRAAFAGCVASLEDDHQPSIVRLEPLLQLEQFDLQRTLLRIVGRPLHFGVVGVVLAPGVHDGPVGAHQHRVIIVVVQHAVAAKRIFEQGQFNRHGSSLVFAGEHQMNEGLT